MKNKNSFLHFFIFRYLFHLYSRICTMKKGTCQYSVITARERLSIVREMLEQQRQRSRIAIRMEIQFYFHGKLNMDSLFAFP